jgi:hypothetical protein
MSRTTLIKFWIAAAILGALLVGRHAHAGVPHFQDQSNFFTANSMAANEDA